LVFLLGVGSILNSGVAAEPKVSCLGRLVPGDDILLIQVPYFTQEPAIVEELLVKEGEKVSKGQLLARTHHADLAREMANEARAKWEVAKKNLELVKAGAEATVIAAQKAQVFRLKAETALEEALYQRRLQLQKDQAISHEEMESAQLKSEASRMRVEQAEKTLLSLSTVQKEKIDLAAAQVAEAESTLKRTEALAALTEIRSPIDGRVLRIHARAGETAGEKGLLELGDTEHMRIEAEVHVSDIRRVAAGQKAEIQSEAFSGKLTGRVQSVDPLVHPNRFLDSDPKAMRENRVVSVWLVLDEPSAVQNLAGAEVSVVIQP